MCEFVYLYACVKLCIEHAGVATIFLLQVYWYFCMPSQLTCLNPKNYRLKLVVESTEIHKIQRACPLDNANPSLSETWRNAVVGGLQETRTPHNFNRTTHKHKSRPCATIFWSMTGLAWGSAGWVGNGSGCSHHWHYSVHAERQQCFMVCQVAQRGFPRYPRDDIASEPYSPISTKETNESNSSI